MSAINKVVFGGNTLIDLTDLTVDQDKLLRGITARRADGNKITGTMDQTITYVDGHGEMSLDEDDYLQYDDTELIPYVIRPDAELIQTYTYDKYAVTDEEWTIPAYATTAQTLKAAENLSPTVSVDLTNYRYFVVERFLTIPEYSIDTKEKGRQEYTFCSYFYELTRAAANELPTIIDSTKKITSVQNFISTNSLYRLLYWSSSSAIALYATNAYGAYMTPSSPSISGSTLTIKAPLFGVRGSTTYFTNTYMNALTDIRYQYVINVYRAPLNNLNIDGWGQDQMLQHIIGCINTNDHKLT